MATIDDIASACVEVYGSIGKGKPGDDEWTVVSAVVAVFDDTDIQVLSLGTGSKCIGKSFMSARGNVLNDSHAEVIARRAFLKYLYAEILSCCRTDSSKVLVRDGGYQFKISNGVKFYFVTSMSPCGDASIMPKWDGERNGTSEFVGECLEERPGNLKRSPPASTEESTVKRLKTDTGESVSGGPLDIHRTGAKCLPDSEIQDPHCPGVDYHRTGAVRTKPGRGDPTLSVSCSDKIARWNSIGWQGALLSLFIPAPIQVEGIICGGGCTYSKNSFHRAVNERTNVNPAVPIHQSGTIFPNLKGTGRKPSPASIIWCRRPTGSNGYLTEVAVAGRKQGVTKKNLEKRVARTSICKKELFVLFGEVALGLPESKDFLKKVLSVDTTESLQTLTYGQVKMMAKDYQSRWTRVKSDCFKVWTKKPEEMLNFTLAEI